MRLDINYKELAPYLITFAVMTSSVVVGNYIFCKIVVKKDASSSSTIEEKTNV
jgi:hypothetical protein